MEEFIEEASAILFKLDGFIEPTDKIISEFEKAKKNLEKVKELKNPKAPLITRLRSRLLPGDESLQQDWYDDHQFDIEDERKRYLDSYIDNINKMLEYFSGKGYDVPTIDVAKRLLREQEKKEWAESKQQEVEKEKIQYEQPKKVEVPQHITHSVKYSGNENKLLDYLLTWNNTLKKETKVNGSVNYSEIHNFLDGLLSLGLAENSSLSVYLREKIKSEKDRISGLMGEFGDVYAGHSIVSVTNIVEEVRKDLKRD